MKQTMLWLALYLPRLAVEIYSRGGTDESPLAVSAGRGRRCAIVNCNDAAKALGVMPGLGVGAAFALAPQLRVHPRALRKEQCALERLAAWALQYTSFVSINSPDGLLLEIGGSLSLFGGRERLCEQIRADIAGLGYEAWSALAPTPSAAWWLARAGGGEADRANLQAHLSVIPLGAMELDAPVLAALHALGVRTLGELLRLPRDGLARRHGAALLQRIDQALGWCPEPRRPFAPPPRFHARLALPAQVHEAPALLFATRRLILELCGWLAAQSGGVDRMTLMLFHDKPPATRLEVGLMRPSRDPAHLQELLREKLDRLELREPINEIALSTAAALALAPATSDFFGERTKQEDGVQLIERLRARLGMQQVSGISTVAEHRPERAWNACEPATPSPERELPPRPLWLLEVPQPLAIRQGQPHLEGPLTLQQGPERIESGWWDNEDVRREYHIAVTSQGARLWVFYDLDERRWYWQGVFS